MFGELQKYLGEGIVRGEPCGLRFFQHRDTEARRTQKEI